jgi:hypothetical protein
MCVILEIQPGVTIPHDHLYHAIHNNEDGYGLVIKHKETLEVIKACPEGGTTVEAITYLLDKNVNHLRYLHLRHRTEGEINLENCHPYTIYEKDGIQIEFMHNGTMHEFAPDKEIKDAVTQKITRHADTRSDSRIFADQILIPLIESLREPNYCSPINIRLISKMWPVASNRGLIISNKYPTLILNPPDWKKIVVKGLNGSPDVEFRASNDTYFDNLVRGRLFDKLEKIKKEKEAEERAKSSSKFPTSTNYTYSAGAWPLTRLKDLDFAPNTFLGDKVCDILSDYDLQCDHGLAQLANLTEVELSHLVEKAPEETVGLLLLLTGTYKAVYDEFQLLESKLKAMTDLDEDKDKKIQELNGIIQRLGKVAA